MALFGDCQGKQAKNFCEYLLKHQRRMSIMSIFRLKDCTQLVQERLSQPSNRLGVECRYQGHSGSERTFHKC
jgi:hypothetical protein